ncbi:mycothiol transferase [Streptomyces oryzae]|uniref:mycothiol transferase n=1 Tax=Streptomyces oryzae TaxID=1434886 RepID=UPI0027DE8EEB|nr:DUF664 domain-containing protein [Streptomyces oryzae]
MRQLLEQWLDFQRATPAAKCAGLTDEQLRTASPPPSELTLLELLRHMTDARHNGHADLLRERIDGETGFRALPDHPWGYFRTGAEVGRVAGVSRMTKAMAVAGVALSATTGCITVTGSHSPGDRPAPQHSPVPGRGAAPPHLVRPSAKEGLSRLPRPGNGSGRDDAADQRRRGGADGARESGTAKDATARSGQQSAPRPAPLPGSQVRGPAVGGDSAGRGRAKGARPGDVPGAPGQRGRGHAPGRSGGAGAGMCELGEAYGRWDPDSPQARICRDTYGR